MLGIDLKKSNPSSSMPPARNYIYMENLRRILPVLRQHGIEAVTVSFNGEGDSGSIDDISYAPREHGDEIKSVPVEHFGTSTFFDEGQWRRQAGLRQSTLNEALDELTYDYLEETGVDWYNNDGGYGELVIDVQAGTVSLNVQVRYTNTSTEYSAERDIETGEDIE